MSETRPISRADSGRLGRLLLAQLPQPLPKPRGVATQDLHGYLYSRPAWGYLASTALGAATSEVNAKKEAREDEW